MANTYSQLYIQIVFAVKGRQNLISKNWKDEMYKYITGIITNQKQKLIAINGMPDHIHILVGIKPDISLSDLVRDIKSSSSKFINEQKWINGKFEWQTGFGAFSYGHSQLTNVIEYIENQEEHHKIRTFKEEYIAFLKLFNIDYKYEYLFEEV
ncbi:MAG: IS200/IS605 family transposase [Flavobacterium sp.]|uniref:IS200/IS605 family transposase n=1 Tax=Flavobacterium sp. TaxID=239 RepID=UPI001B2723CF|nr:IS200/IS605 family transposase [Flavobacterium sp.]MBO9582906.1 IS200/IS605 family transposase [Flavobacterium sp.]